MKKIITLFLCSCFCVLTNSVLLAQEDFSNPFEIGNVSITTNCETASYSYTGNTCNYNNDVAGPSQDIVYSFTLLAETNVSIDMCGYEFDTFIYLYNSELNEIAYNDDGGSCGDDGGSYLNENLIAGTYFLVCEGWNTDCGEYYLTISAINDQDPPVFDLPVLPDLLGNCFVEEPSAPTATDICAGNVFGYTHAEFPIFETSVITWTYIDMAGNIATQNQNIVIDDSEPPIIDLALLDDLTDECMVIPNYPTATDNCLGTIYGDADVLLPVTALGTTVITWSYIDGNGNVATQTQNVTITDLNPPVPDIIDLPDLAGCLSFDVLPIPTATDFCIGEIEGVSDAILPITESTTVTWTYDDGHGNISTQTQSVTVGVDMQPPFPDMEYLDEVYGCNSISEIEPPTATDACVGTIIGIPDADFPITESTEIVWSFDDGNGNTSTQLQNVLIVNIDNSITNNSPILTANFNADSYQWIDCDDENSPIEGENGQSFTALVNGSYAVLIYYNECMVISNCIEVNVTDIAEFVDEKIVVFPNPAEETVFIGMPEVGQTSWSVMTLTGQVINQGIAEDQNFNLNLTNIAAGLYLLRLDQNDQNNIVKVVIK